MVAGTSDGLRSFRLDRVVSAEPTDEPVLRPIDFDLTAAWRTLVTQLEDRLFAATVTARADQDTLPVLQRLFGGRLSVGGLLADGRREIEASGPSVEVVATQPAGLGARVEVVDPPQAREHLARLGRDLMARYGVLHDLATT